MSDNHQVEFVTREELRGELRELRGEFHTMRSEVRADLKDMRGELSKMHDGLNTMHGELRTQTHWMMGILVTIAVGLAGIAYGTLRLSVGLKPPATTSSSTLR
jgi:hypothetical protein